MSMIKTNEKLTILHDDNSSFTEYSDELLQFDRDTASVTMVAAEDFIYIGFYKPINSFYVEMGTANTNAASLSVKYYNGSAFTAVSNQFDDTKGFNRNGYIRWDRQIDDRSNLEAKTTINSSEKYWYQIAISADSSAMVFNGLNIVFSDDQDLKRVLFEYDKYLPSGETSHILSHVAARDEIVQTLNLQGKYKVNAVNGRYKDISAFDLLDISEVKLASTYLVLSSIFMSVSDQVDDQYLQKSQLYRTMYNKIINVMKLSIDEDDDGKQDKSERNAINYGFVTRL